MAAASPSCGAPDCEVGGMEVVSADGVPDLCPVVETAYDAWVERVADWYGVCESRARGAMRLITMVSFWLDSLGEMADGRIISGTYERGPHNDGHGAIVRVRWLGCRVSSETLIHEWMHHALLRIRGDADPGHQDEVAWARVVALGGELAPQCYSLMPER